MADGQLHDPFHIPSRFHTSVSAHSSSSWTRNKKDEEDRLDFLRVHELPLDSWPWYKPANCLIVGSNCSVETKIANAYFS